MQEEGRHPLFDEMYPSEVLVIVPLVEGLDLEIYSWREYDHRVDMSDEWLMPALLNAAHQKLIDVHAEAGRE